MKKIASIIMVLLAMTAYAQQGTFSLTPHVRAGYTHISNTIDKTMRNYFSDELGAECEYGITDGLGVALGVDLGTSFALKREGASISVGSSGFDESFIDFYNINVSLLASYHFRQFALQAGFQMNNTVAGETYDMSKNVVIIPGMSSPGYDVFRRTFYSVPVGMTYEFDVFPAVLGLRYNIPVTQINKLKSDKNSYMSSIMLSVGYRL